jgi:CSLREA domain-containing protein
LEVEVVPLFRHAVRVLSLALLLVSFPAAAAIFDVDSTADAVDATPGNGVCATAGNVCTLRAAIQEANALAGDDTINVPAGTYTLTIPGMAEYFSATGDLNIRSNMTIDGAGMGVTIIEAGASVAAGIDRVFDMRAGPPTVTLADMTIRHGNSGGASSGGIYSNGNLTLQRVEVTNNLAATNFAGGIYAESGTTLTLSDSVIANNTATAAGGIWLGNATATITNTTFSGNVATTGSGGALWVRDNGSATISNSTFSGNSSVGSGSAIAQGASNADTASVAITNSTLSGNTGGAVHYTRTAATLNMTNVTIANNASGTTINGPSNIRNTIIAYTAGNNCVGVPVSGGNNLSDDASCVASLNDATDLHFIDPLLSPLALNAPGTTETHALQAGSPALNRYSINCLATDQRGFARPSGTSCDIGAYELEIIAVPGTLQFQSAAYAVVEGTPSIVIIVERIGGSDGDVDVDYDTDDGTATELADYSPQTGTRTFNPGVTMQPIVIPIVNDGVPEGDQTFTVRLFNPAGGATLGTPTTTTVTISDPAAVIPAVPTVSQWGLIAIALALAVVAFRRFS